MCESDNHLFRKTCKKCGHALNIEEGNKCAVCNQLNGPFAKKCRACNTELNSHTYEHEVDKKKKDSSYVHTKKREQKVQQFHDLLKTSYLHKDNLFVGISYEISLNQDLIVFKLAEVTYKFEEINDLKYIFNMKYNQIPQSIKDNIVTIFKPMMNKYVRQNEVSLLNNNLGFENFLMTFVNKDGQLAGATHLPIFENELLHYFNLILETCKSSDSHIDMYESEVSSFEQSRQSEDFEYDSMFDKFEEETLVYHDYVYKLIQKDKENRTYRIGSKLVHIKVNIIEKTFTFTYLNQSLVITDDESPFTSILLINWMMNHKIITTTLEDQLNKYSSDTHKFKVEKSPDYDAKTYSSLTINGFSITPLGLNTILINFPLISAHIVEPIHPKMEYLDFKFLIDLYTSFAANNLILQQIRMIEDSTERRVSIHRIINDSCIINVRSKNTIMSDIILSPSTTNEHVLKFIDKINFIDQVIK